MIAYWIQCDTDNIEDAPPQSAITSASRTTCPQCTNGTNGTRPVRSISANPSGVAVTGSKYIDRGLVLISGCGVLPHAAVAAAATIGPQTQHHGTLPFPVND